ncbi:hypothetical protein ABZ858_00435 [Streptomyces sp. NPDC047017]|uniref:hypothetical protein n=1 Tax=Streptomyces sp. NPDC047017 TaxID=3155024 RepID=UPI0033C591DE
MHEDIAGQIWEAVDHWVEGRREESARLLNTLMNTQPPNMLFGIACGIAVIAKAAMQKIYGNHCDTCFWAIGAVGCASPEDAVPPPALFAARFIAATLNGDKDTALALYLAVDSRGTEQRSECLHTLLATTGEAVLLATSGAGR